MEIAIGLGVVVAVVAVVSALVERREPPPPLLLIAVGAIGSFVLLVPEVKSIRECLT